MSIERRMWKATYVNIPFTLIRTTDGFEHRVIGHVEDFKAFKTKYEQDEGPLPEIMYPVLFTHTNEDILMTNPSQLRCCVTWFDAPFSAQNDRVFFCPTCKKGYNHWGDLAEVTNV